MLLASKYIPHLSKKTSTCIITHDFRSRKSNVSLSGNRKSFRTVHLSLFIHLHSFWPYLEDGDGTDGDQDDDSDVHLGGELSAVVRVVVLVVLLGVVQHVVVVPPGVLVLHIQTSLLFQKQV